LAGRALQINVYPLDFEEFLQFKNVELKIIDSELVYKVFEKYFLEYISF
jgi:predicted AAA+ superfamily ATPase